MSSRRSSGPRRFKSDEERDRAAIGGEFSDWAVLSHDLTPGRVPPRGASWGDVYGFALSYDGYALWNEVGEFANRARERWYGSRILSDTLDELRACLFFEQRRYHHYGWDPTGEDAEYFWALLDAIREVSATAMSAAAARGAAAKPDGGVDPRLEGRLRGAMLGLLLGDAAGRASASMTTGAGALRATAGGQLACFTVEGPIRAAVRGDHKGICHPPSVVWHAISRWAYGQGICRETVSRRWGPGAGNSSWPDGWLAMVPVLRERRGTAPATARALAADAYGSDEPPKWTSQGAQSLTRGLACGVVGARASQEMVADFARDSVLFSHSASAADVASAAAVGVATCLRTANLESGITATVAHLRGHEGALQRALADGARQRMSTDALREHATSARAGATLAGAIFLLAAADADRLPLPERLGIARTAPDGPALAATVGAFLGAAQGVDALPIETVSRLELVWVGDTLARDLHLQFTSRPSGTEYEAGWDPKWWDRYPGW